MKWVRKGVLIATLPLCSDDKLDWGEECFSYVHIYRSPESGGVFFNYSHEDAIYCPLKNIYIDYCPHKDKDIPCRACPDAEFFLELEDGKIVPVLKLPSHGII